MNSVTILHNPRCSKSRQTLALLQEHGITPTVVEYLKSPLTVEELKNVYNKLNVSSVRDMMRTKEEEYKSAQLDATDITDDVLFEAMARTPKLMERPIVICADKARIGRPPESVLDIL